MSETDDKQELESTPAESASDSEILDIENALPADTPAEDALPADTPAEEVQPEKRRGNGVTWLALLVAVVALAAAGYTISRDWLAADDSRTADDLARLDARVVTFQQGLSSLDSRVTDLDAAGGNAATRIDGLRRELAEKLGGLETLPSRMSSLESSVAALSGVSEASRDTWLLAEAEYYLQIANAQLQLANNPALAALALGMADERVMQISDPSLMDVRRAIANDKAALDVIEKPDIAGATLTLASLARVVESLPMTSSAERVPGSARSSETDEGGVARAWSSLKDAMSGLVKVTPPDQAKLDLLTPDAEYFLRSNLALQLQSARLALLRGEQAVFEQTLDDASALMSQYFDSDSAAVGGALATLAEIRSNALVATSLPDISGSLQLLRQYRTLRESSQ